MRALVQARVSDPSSAAVPLSEAVPHYVDVVGRGNRVNRLAHVKACAMLTVCGAKQWAHFALRLINREEGRAQSEGPPMRLSLIHI
eukprot:6823242-Alexandrium_andersonii.AAC.1